MIGVARDKEGCQHFRHSRRGLAHHTRSCAFADACICTSTHPHREHNRALSIPLRCANSNLCLHPHLRSLYAVPGLVSVRISFRGSSRCGSPCRVSLNWRPRARLASNASLWSSLSGESFIGGIHCSFRSLLSLSLNLLLFRPAALRRHPQAIRRTPRSSPDYAPSSRSFRPMATTSASALPRPTTTPSTSARSSSSPRPRRQSPRARFPRARRPAADTAEMATATASVTATPTAPPSSTRPRSSSSSKRGSCGAQTRIGCSCRPSCRTPRCESGELCGVRVGRGCGEDGVRATRERRKKNRYECGASV